jgi:hypothetical protein
MFAVLASKKYCAGAVRFAVASVFASTMVAVCVGATRPAAVLCDSTLQPVEHIGQRKTAVCTLPRIGARALSGNTHASTTTAVRIGPALLPSGRGGTLVQPAVCSIKHGVLSVVLEF